MNTYNLTRLFIDEDFRVGSGSQNNGISYMLNAGYVNSQIDFDLDSVGYTAMKLREQNTGLVRAIIDDPPLDAFYNGLRLYAELPAATKATLCPNTWKYWDHVDVDGVPTGVARTYAEYFHHVDSIDTLSVMYLVQITVPQFGLVGPAPLSPIYKYNTDGTENTALAKEYYETYKLIHTAFNVTNLYSYKQGQQILNSDEYNVDSVVPADRTVLNYDMPTSNADHVGRQMVDSLGFKQGLIDFIESLPDKSVASIGELCSAQVSPSNKVKVMGVKTS